VQWGNGERPRRMEMDECMVYHCMNVIQNACIEKDKINKKCGNRHQTFNDFAFRLHDVPDVVSCIFR
jgi:hypothetical protein